MLIRRTPSASSARLAPTQPASVRHVPSPAWPLATERLVLRPFKEADFAGFYAIHSDEGVVRWLYNDARNEEEARALLARKMAVKELTEEGQWLSCAVTLRDTDELVG